ncbi:hypothetical protein [Zhongshania borealis]|uniref:Uncharacterized protein n=1 Tax=Zhongshania borealis TaxID=889488 RepID=A0ABP7WET5_9GAMM
MKVAISLQLSSDAYAEIHLAFTREAICKLVDLHLKDIIHEFNSLEFEARTNQKTGCESKGSEEI